jgi:hypothetical protein
MNRGASAGVLRMWMRTLGRPGQLSVACLCGRPPASAQAGVEQVLSQLLIKLYEAGIHGDQQLACSVPAIEIAAAVARADLSGPTAAAKPSART